MNYYELGTEDAAYRQYVIDASAQQADSDKRAILESWMGRRSTSENSSVIHFAEADQQLRLQPGSTKALIKSVATRWRYLVQHEGEHTILFRQENRPIHRSISF